MPGNDTLLAYLVSSFPGNTENIATEALRHIFDHSDASIEALNDVVQSGVRGVNPVTTVKSQVVHADGAKPGLVGFNEDGEERVLVEVKFWASPTPSLPSTHAARGEALAGRYAVGRAEIAQPRRTWEDKSCPAITRF